MILMALTCCDDDISSRRKGRIDFILDLMNSKGKGYINSCAVAVWEVEGGSVVSTHSFTMSFKCPLTSVNIGIP